MSAGIWIGVSNVARKVTKPNIGIGNVARGVSKVWRGVGNVARVVFQGLSVLYDNGSNIGNLKKYSSTSATVTFGTDAISFTTKKDGNNYFLTTDEAIDYSQYSKICVEIMFTSGSTSADYFYVSLDSGGESGLVVEREMAYNTKITITGTLSRMTSPGTSFVLGVDSWDDSGDVEYSVTGKIYRIWFE